MRNLKKVRHSNQLNQTLSTIQLSAKRVLFLALSQVNSRTQMDMQKTIYVTASDFAEITKTDIKNAYRHLKEGADALRLIGLRIEKEEIEIISKEIGLSGKTPDYMNLNLMEYCVYNVDEGRVGIKFTNTASKYISSIVGVERKYTTQALISVVMLSTTHSTTLYQLIRKKIGLSLQRFGNGFEISIEDLKKEMGLINQAGDESYPDYKIFKRDVLTKSIKEINGKTEIFDLDFTVSGKIGRRVDKLFFKYKIDEERFKESLKSNLEKEDDKFLEGFDKLFPTESDGDNG
ncbi:TPA: replication initiation protein [Yersinia enterocolitica]|nr:replication initiation protein [Yersinia enterocolitica]